MTAVPQRPATQRHRRIFLRATLSTGAGALLAGLGSVEAAPARSACADPFAGGELLGTLGFEGEGPAPLDRAVGAGLDGRLYTDLSGLAPDSLLIPNERFYIRTRYPDRLTPGGPWLIQARGLVAQPGNLRLSELMPRVRPIGTYLLECSGNAGGAYFGLLSACAWSGIPMSDVLALLRPLRAATAVLVSGFDDHSQPSRGSVPGASWIFRLQQLARAGAFLATHMNGRPLPLDHGAPVRLVVPGWYGCACIKWVNEIRLVGADAPATSQMQEFASRTHQEGVPALARDYRPASLDQAAMPVRIEKWRLPRGALLYRVIGIAWGGDRTTDRLTVRFKASEPFVPVKVCPPQRQNATWTFWSHPWRPAAPGAYTLRPRIDDVTIPQHRLDIGFYDRTVVIAEA